MISTKVGESIPPNTKHAVSVCLPTWEATVGYEESDPDVVTKMTTGYPRFFIHKSIQKLCNVLIEKYAKEGETCLVFPSYNVAKRCREYIKVKADIVPPPRIRILQLSTSRPSNDEERTWKRECKIAIVFVNQQFWPLLKQYWQHTGEIISSRLAEYVLHELFVVEKKTVNKSKMNDTANEDSAEEIKGEEDFIETRFGRNLDFTFADRAKLLIKRRIARKVVDVEDDETETNASNQAVPSQTAESTNQDTNNGEQVQGGEVNAAQLTTAQSIIPPEHIDEEEFEQINISSPDLVREAVTTAPHLDPERDVFLFPSGMASIFTAHRLLLKLDSLRVNRTRQSANAASAANSGYASPNQGSASVVGYGPPYKKTVMFGFPYTDTLSILSKFNHTHFLGMGDSTAMDTLKEILHSGEQILAVFMETPSNPLLKMGDLLELKRLADIYGFYVVVDETAGGFVNIDVLPHADLVCSSLTKIFSGDSNVMAGSLVLNPSSRLYEFAQEFFRNGEYEDCLWCEDAIYLERNSRDFVTRTLKVNSNAEMLLNDVLIPEEGHLFSKIYYPRLTSEETKQNYDTVRCKPDGGYGGLFSLTFYEIEQAKKFFNALELCKGPSLGTNFTLACPYAVLAHYAELEKVAQYGVETNLVRVSVGLEDAEHLRKVFRKAISEALAVQQK